MKIFMLWDGEKTKPIQSQYYGSGFKVQSSAVKGKRRYLKKQSQFAGHLQNFNGEHFRSRGYAVYAIGKIRANRNETATAVKPTIASRGAPEDIVVNRLFRHSTESELTELLRSKSRKLRDILYKVCFINDFLMQRFWKTVLPKGNGILLFTYHT